MRSILLLTALGTAVPAVAFADKPKKGPPPVFKVREIVLDAIVPEQGRLTRRIRFGLPAGSFRDEEGAETELVFDVSTLGHASSSDLVLPRRGRRERALVRRVGRTREETRHLVIPRRGRVAIDGEEIRRETEIRPGQELEIGPNRLRFDARVRNVELRRRSGGMLSAFSRRSARSVNSL